uniref:SYMRK n=1 Tax=Arundo donax TaxID=35708 RepID=A0A0A9EGH6_ARUDO
MDLMYSDELFSMIRASSSSLRTSSMLGRKVEKGSVHTDATSSTLHMASEQYCPFMPGSTISSILYSLMYGFAHSTKLHSSRGR